LGRSQLLMDGLREKSRTLEKQVEKPREAYGKKKGYGGRKDPCQRPKPGDIEAREGAYEIGWGPKKGTWKPTTPGCWQYFCP